MIDNTKVLYFNSIVSEVGSLVPLEFLRQIPFVAKRIYYIYGVPGNVIRGFHSHRLLKQVLICIHGRVKIKVKTPYSEDVVELNKPNIGLYIGHMVWREMYDFSEDAVLIVLASEYYSEDDYIRDYGSYTKEAIEYFKNKGEKYK